MDDRAAAILSSSNHRPPLWIDLAYQCRNMGSFPFKTSITVSTSSKTFDTVNNMTHNPAAPSP